MPTPRKVSVTVSRRQSRQLVEGGWITGEVAFGIELDLAKGEDAEQVLVEEAARLRALLAEQFSRKE